MNWDKFERSKAYYLLPLFVWWGFGLLALLSDKNGFLVGIPLFIGGILVSARHYRKHLKLLQGDKK
jgi:hypothetical protein